MSVSDPCVSLSTGTSSPDERVNYVRGMVLGVDEFVQEQTYFLQKDYLHERALHGFGTVSGLQVTVSPSGTDYTVQVGTGIGIDQWGREIVLSCPQCANLGAWLAAQESATSGTIAEHSGVSGELTVYVVASYDTCLDDLVPLPGQPCSSSAQTQVASRIRDAWNIDLRWEPPPMPQWDADRRLARLIDSVEIVAGLDPADSDEDAIIADLLTLPDVDLGSPPMWPPDLDWPINAISGTPQLRLPAATAADALDRIFTVWVTQVRPQLMPALDAPDPASDPAILLATITFVAASPFDVTAPVIDSCESPDDTDRPFLLHTRLIQELQRLGGAGSRVAPRQLVALNAVVQPTGRVTEVTARFLLDTAVRLTGPVSVTRADGSSADCDPVAQAGYSDAWQLTPPSGFSVADGEILEFLFDGSVVELETGGPTLADAVANGLNVLDATPDGDVLAYLGVHVPPAQQTQPLLASKEWVTITELEATIESGDLPKGGVAMMLWFHPEPMGTRDDAIVERVTLEVFDDSTGQNLPFIEYQGNTGPTQDPNYGNVWVVAVRRPERFPAFLRLVFETTKTELKTPAGDLTLAQWIGKAKIPFIGWDAHQERIVSFGRFGEIGQFAKAPGQG